MENELEIDIEQNFPNGSWTITLYAYNENSVSVLAKRTYHDYDREEALSRFKEELITNGNNKIWFTKSSNRKTESCSTAGINKCSPGPGPHHTQNRCKKFKWSWW